MVPLGRVCLSLALLAACARTPEPAGSAAARLDRVLAATQELSISTSIAQQLKYGRPIDRLAGVSLGDEEARARTAAALLDSLGAVTRGGLTPDQEISAEVAEWVLQGQVEAPKYYWLSFASITPYQSPLTNELLFLGRDLPLDTPAARTRLLARLADIGPLTDSIRAGLEARAGRGIRLPRPEIDQVVGALGAMRAAGTASPYAPPAARIAALPDSVRPAFEAAVEAAVDQSITPALGRLTDFLQGDYRAAAPDGVGLSQYPGGEAYYRYLVARNTTLERSPEEIQRTGLAYLATLEGQMDSLLRVIGFQGTRRQFQDAMNRDPRFLAQTPEEVGARYQTYYDLIAPLVPKLFSRIPKAPAEFRRLNPALEGAQTYGFYQSPTPASPIGVYFYNASNLAHRSLFQVAPIAYHELVPGHHFQVSLALENDSLPRLRRDFYTTAFGEGWAEYASELPLELGLYSDPYDRYGRLISEAFLTTRLIVDPGMNLLGWSRDSAMAFMRIHTMMAESEIRSETLRYSVDMPAQALGYKLGAMELWRLRHRAEQALGDRFDVRAFHALILDHGNLPMSIVGRMVDRWIAASGGAPAS